MFLQNQGVQLIRENAALLLGPMLCRACMWLEERKVVYMKGLGWTRV